MWRFRAPFGRGLDTREISQCAPSLLQVEQIGLSFVQLHLRFFCRQRLQARALWLLCRPALASAPSKSCILARVVSTYQWVGMCRPPARQNVTVDLVLRESGAFNVGLVIGGEADKCTRTLLMLGPARRVIDVEVGSTFGRMPVEAANVQVKQSCIRPVLDAAGACRPGQRHEKDQAVMPVRRY